LAWFVADTPLPPSISGQTSLPAYMMGWRPLNKLSLPGARAPAERSYRAAIQTLRAKKERGPGRFRGPVPWFVSRLAAAGRSRPAEHRAEHSAYGDAGAGVVVVAVRASDHAAQRCARRSAEGRAGRRIAAAVTVV